MEEIPINVRVRCTDGKCGRSTHVIVNPVKRQITHFVIRYKKLPESADRLVPVEKISEISEDQIRLSCTRAELAKMPPFTTKRFVRKGDPDYAMAYMALDPNAFTHPMVARDVWVDDVPVQQVPDDELAVHRGMDVRTSAGKIGTLDELVVDPASGEISHILMREGHLWGKKEVAIPVSAIDAVEADVVYLNIDKKAVAVLPPVPVKRFPVDG